MQSKGFSRVFSNTTFKSIDSSALSFLYGQVLHLYTTIGKTIALTIWTFVGTVMSLLFNTLSRFAIAFLPRSKDLLISCLQSPSTVILEGFLGWLRWCRICLQCRKPRFSPRVGKISWRREWLPTPVFLPGEFHGYRKLVGPWVEKNLDM